MQNATSSFVLEETIDIKITPENIWGLTCLEDIYIKGNKYNVIKFYNYSKQLRGPIQFVVPYTCPMYLWESETDSILIQANKLTIPDSLKKSYMYSLASGTEMLENIYFVTVINEEDILNDQEKMIFQCLLGLETEKKNPLTGVLKASSDMEDGLESSTTFDLIIRENEFEESDECESYDLGDEVDVTLTQAAINGVNTIVDEIREDIEDDEVSLHSTDNTQQALNLKCKILKNMIHARKHSGLFIILWTILVGVFLALLYHDTGIKMLGVTILKILGLPVILSIVYITYKEIIRYKNVYQIIDNARVSKDCTCPIIFNKYTLHTKVLYVGDSYIISLDSTSQNQRPFELCNIQVGTSEGRHNFILPKSKVHYFKEICIGSTCHYTCYRSNTTQLRLKANASVAKSLVEIDNYLLITEIDGVNIIPEEDSYYYELLLDESGMWESLPTQEDCIITSPITIQTLLDKWDTAIHLLLESGDVVEVSLKDIKIIKDTQTFLRYENKQITEIHILE